MTKYQLNEEKMFADVADGVAIIINAETGVYYGMNSLGTKVYENLINGATTEKVLDKLKTINSEVEESFNEYIDFMLKNGILTENTEAGDDVEPENIELEEGDENFPKVQEYMDAQELLLADPIHEVKEETGWSPEKDSLNEDKEDVARREAKMQKK